MIGRCLEAIYADAAPGPRAGGRGSMHRRDGKIAAPVGARVLERGPADEPGRAAARQAGLEHARALEWDAVVMVDADSVIAPGFFSACERALACGAVSGQARSEGRPGRTLADEAALAAFTLQGVTMPRGRDRLGASVRLRGTGMVIRRRRRPRSHGSARRPPRTSSSHSTCCSRGFAAGTSMAPACARRARAAGARSAVRSSATRPVGWPLRGGTWPRC